MIDVTLKLKATIETKLLISTTTCLRDSYTLHLEVMTPLSREISSLSLDIFLPFVLSLASAIAIMAVLTIGG